MNDTFIRNFMELAAIPHQSKHEEAVSLHLYERARKAGLTAVRDEHGNVIVERPAAPGYENAPLTIMQAHMDMVCVGRPGCEYDPLTSPIEVINDGSTLKAACSSLGADDGAGVALIEELLEDPSLKCGALRGIYTVDEEKGMSGAEGLDPVYLQGRYLLNLDWESAGSLCCSSAGSKLFRFVFESEWEESADTGYELNVSGLLGGHSGTEIHTARGNALRFAAGYLRALSDSGIPVRIGSFESGTASNAIPCSARVSFTAPGCSGDILRSILDGCIDRFMEEFGALEERAEFALLDSIVPQVQSAVVSKNMIRFLSEVKTGVNTWSPDYPSLVESSANLAQIHLLNDNFEIEVYQRSSVPQRTVEMEDEYLRLAASCGAGFIAERESPSWPVRSGSALVKLCQREYHAITGREISVEPVHAGLECGAWSRKNEELDMISIGPEVRDIHSPEETLELWSIDLLRDLVVRMLMTIRDE